MVDSPRKPQAVHTSTVPFPSSPTPLPTPSPSNSPTSTWTSFSATTSHGSSPPDSTSLATPPDSALHRPARSNWPNSKLNANAPARHFDLRRSGGGFITSTTSNDDTPKPTAATATDTSTTTTNTTTAKPSIRRARSPSAPPASTYHHNHIAPIPTRAFDVDSLTSGFNLASLTSYGLSTLTIRDDGWPNKGSAQTASPSFKFNPFGSEYEARPYPEASHNNRSTTLDDQYMPFERSMTHSSATPAFLFQTPPPTQPSLTHHQSTPNLGISGLLGGTSGGLAGRALSDVHESDEGLGSESGEAARRLASRSMSAIQSVKTSDRKNVYIHSVRPAADEDTLSKQAEQFGEVLSCRIQSVGDAQLPLVPNGTGYQANPQRRCAFVLFRKHEEAAAFIKYLQELNVLCDYAKEDFQTEWKSREDRNSSNLYIQNLPLSADIEDLYELLSPYGRILSAKFLASQDKRYAPTRRGPAMARLECRAQADAAIKGLNDKPYRGDSAHTLTVRIADSAEQKEFKRQNMLHNISPTHTTDREARRASVPDQRVMAAEAAKIREQKRQLQQALEDIERQEEQLAFRTAPYTTRGYGQSLYSPNDTMDSFVDAYATPTRPSLHHSTSASTFRTDRTWSNGSTYAGTHIWTPTGSSRLASSSRDELDPIRRVRFEAGLHHARSTPDLGKGDDVARLLWDDAGRY